MLIENAHLTQRIQTITIKKSVPGQKRTERWATAELNYSVPNNDYGHMHPSDSRNYRDEIRH